MRDFSYREVTDPRQLERLLREAADEINTLKRATAMLGRSRGQQATHSALLQLDDGMLVAIRTALQQHGTTPLNVEGLQGVLSSAQLAGAVIAETALPNANNYPVGTLGVVTTPTAVFYYAKSGNPRTWEPIGIIPGNMMTTDSNQSIALGVVKTWLARQVFTGGLDAGAQIKVTAGGIDVDAGGVNVDAGGVTVAAGGVNVNGGGVIVTAGQFDSTSQLSARATQTVAQSIPNTTDTAITFSGTHHNQGAVWDVANPTRLTVPVGGAGIWLFVGNMTLAGSAGGSMRQLFIRGNGSVLLALQTANPNAVTGQVNLSLITSVLDTEYVELVVYQNSGGALNTSGSYTTWFGGHKLC